jgi:hypothetical protein
MRHARTIKGFGTLPNAADAARGAAGRLAVGGMLNDADGDVAPGSAMAP